jgi:phosphate transport system protein
MAENLQSHTVSSFDKELKTISRSLIMMGDMITELLGIFLETLSNPEDSNISGVKEKDKRVNEIDTQVEKLSTNIIALRHPLAVDLRYVIAATKISTMIERQGDMVESAIKKIAGVNPEISGRYKESLTEMAKYNIEMINYAIKGFSNQDTNNANKVWRIEDKIDDLSDNCFTRIKEDLKKDSTYTDDYVSLMLIVRSLERVGDYCTKVTKAVHWVITGKRVRESDF